MSPLPSPLLDDRSYEQLRDELVRRIPVYEPEWTDFNGSDPAITLLELFAFLSELALTYADDRRRRRQRERLRRALLGLALVGLGGLVACSARRRAKLGPHEELVCQDREDDTDKNTER